MPHIVTWQDHCEQYTVNTVYDFKTSLAHAPNPNRRTTLSETSTPKRRDHTPENQISETKKEFKLKVLQTVCMIGQPIGNAKEDHRIVSAGKRPNIRRMNSLRADTLNLVYSDHLTIGHFTVVCLVFWPLNRGEAGGDLVLLQTCLLFKCESWYSHANKSVNMIIYI